eukprot:6295039-Prymnesium_polylepis.2
MVGRRDGVTAPDSSAARRVVCAVIGAAATSVGTARNETGGSVWTDCTEGASVAGEWLSIL